MVARPLLVTTCALPLLAAAQPEKPSEPAAADVVVLSRTDHAETLISADLPLVLTKAGRVERALVRRAVFVSSSISLTRPAARPVDGPQRCQWSHARFLQRQICFASMTGQFACTEPDVATLPDEADGEMSISDDDAKAGRCSDAFPASAAARAQLVETLRGRADAMFDDDQRTKVDPMLKAAATAPGGRRMRQNLMVRWAAARGSSAV